MNWIDYLLIGAILLSVITVLLYLNKTPSSCHTKGCSKCESKKLCSKDFWNERKLEIHQTKKIG